MYNKDNAYGWDIDLPKVVVYKKLKDSGWGFDGIFWTKKGKEEEG